MVEVSGSHGQYRRDQQDGIPSTNTIHLGHDHSSSNEQRQIGDREGGMIGSPDGLAKSGRPRLALEKTTLLNIILQISERDSTHQGEQLRSGGKRKQQKVKNDGKNATRKEHKKIASCEGNLLEIGSWKRSSKKGSDLVFKCHFASKSLVWEIEEDGLKMKIEVPWSSITAIRAIFSDEQPSVLDIELKEPPQFFQERDPHPRKHPIWQGIDDFTGGQASINRRHHLEFADRSFETGYKDLLLLDAELAKLSENLFPSSSSQFFQKLRDHFGHFPYNSNMHRSTVSNSFRPQVGYRVPSGFSELINPQPLNSMSQEMVPLGSLASSSGMACPSQLPMQTIERSLNSYEASALLEQLLMQRTGFTSALEVAPGSAHTVSYANYAVTNMGNGGSSYFRNQSPALPVFPPTVNGGSSYFRNQSPALPVFPPTVNGGLIPLQHERNPSWNQEMVNPSSVNLGMQQPQLAGIPMLEYGNQDTDSIHEQDFVDNLLCDPNSSDASPREFYHVD